MARRDLQDSAASGQGLQQSAQAFGQHVFHRQLRLWRSQTQRLQAELGHINDTHHEIVRIDALLRTRPPRGMLVRLALNNQRDVLERTLQQSLQRVGHACKAVHGRPWRLMRVLMAQAETPVQG